MLVRGDRVHVAGCTGDPKPRSMRPRSRATEPISSPFSASPDRLSLLLRVAVEWFGRPVEAEPRPLLVLPKLMLAACFLEGIVPPADCEKAMWIRSSPTSSCLTPSCTSRRHRRSMYLQAGSRGLNAGFDRASESLGPAHYGHTAGRGPAPAACLKGLQMWKNAGGSPLPSLSRQGQRAQPLGVLKGRSNPDGT